MRNEAKIPQNALPGDVLFAAIGVMKRFQLGGEDSRPINMSALTSAEAVVTGERAGEAVDAMLAESGTPIARYLQANAPDAFERRVLAWKLLAVCGARVD